MNLFAETLLQFVLGVVWWVVLFPVFPEMFDDEREMVANALQVAGRAPIVIIFEPLGEQIGTILDDR